MRNTATWYRIHIDPDEAPKDKVIEWDNDFPDTRCVGISPTYSCSCCGCQVDEGQHRYFNYCPVCGSKMERMDIEKEILQETKHFSVKAMATWKAALYYTESYYELACWRMGEKIRRKKQHKAMKNYKKERGL